MSKQEKKQHGGIGFAAGVFVGTVLQPLEIIKIGLIIGPANNPELKKKLSKGNIFKHTQLVTNHIYQTEGIRGFFRSYIPSIFRNGGGSGVYFFTLQYMDKLTAKYIKTHPIPHKNKITDNERQEEQNQQMQQYHFINSAIARMASTVAINPISVVGSRIEVPGFNEYKGMTDGFRQIYQKEGLRSFFKGTFASCLKDGPFAGLYLMIYRYIKEKFEQQQQIKLHYTTVSMVSGLVAGFFATISSHPLEIIRARLQISQNTQNTGITKEFLNIYKEDGFQGYFRGITPRLVKKPIANSLTFVVFEALHYNVYKEKW